MNKIIHLVNMETDKLVCGRKIEYTMHISSKKEFKALPYETKCLWCMRLTNRIKL